MDYLKWKKQFILFHQHLIRIFVPLVNEGFMHLYNFNIICN